MYLLIIATIMAVVGAANIVFAFVDPPAAIEPMFDGFSRRIRFVVQFLPEAKQTMAARLLTGVGILAASAVAATVWLGQG
ncbi:MAG: hypothetical protein AAF721_39450 [Myxococcota bacterium]